MHATRLLLPLIAAWLLAGCGDDGPTAIPKGTPAPAFRAQRLDGGQVDFPADFRGRAVVLRFWADWCPYCNREMREIEPIYQRLKGQGLEVLAVNVAQTPGVARKFVEDTGISYPVLLDEKGQIARRYGVIGLPHTYFIDRQGRVQGKVVGETPGEVFEREAQRLLQAAEPQ